jgi:hypothetical protein
LIHQQTFHSREEAKETLIKSDLQKASD